MLVIEVDHMDLLNSETDAHVRWTVAEKLRRAGVPIHASTGLLTEEGTLTWIDLNDKDVRRYTWDPVKRTGYGTITLSNP